MDAEDRLKALIECLPSGGRVTLSSEDLRELLGESVRVARQGPVAAPGLTVNEVALRYGRSPTTVRGWIRDGRLEAYRIGREYRVPLEAIPRFEQGGRVRASKTADPASGSGSDLGDWRRFIIPDEP